MPHCKPNLFIVGAAKAGTNTLYRALSEHPDIYMSATKEPTYFGRDLAFRRPRISQAEYLSLFAGGHRARYRGEASVLYLYSQTAPEEIHRFSPDARIVIMLRDPVDMVYSGFWQNRKTAIEDVGEFERALALEPERRQGRRVPKSAYVLNGLFYSDHARAPMAARRYETVFGSDAVFVGDFEDLKHDREAFYRRLFRFLGLPPILPGHVAEYPGTRPKLTAFTRLARGDHPALVKAGRALVPGPARRPLAAAVRRLEHRWNQRPGYPGMRPETRRRLEAEYAACWEMYRAVCAESRARWEGVECKVGGKQHD